MLCHEVEVFNSSSMYGLPNTGLIMNRSSPVCKPAQRRQKKYRFLQQLLPSDEISYGSLSNSEISEPDNGSRKSKDGVDLCCYRCQLEEDVRELQKQLQEEIDLHTTLQSAIGQKAGALSSLPCHLPIDAQELLASIAKLEVTISKLEEETVALHFQLSQERSERRLVEYKLKKSSSSSSLSLSLSPSVSYSSSEELKNQHQLIPFLGSSPDDTFLLQHSTHRNFCPESSSSKTNSHVIKEKTGDSRRARKRFLRNNEIHKSIVQHGCQDTSDEGKCMNNLWKKPNHLSEQMVKYMKDIFIHLGDTVKIPSKFLPAAITQSPKSPLAHIILSSLPSFSGSSSVSLTKSPPGDFQIKEDVFRTGDAYDPYNTPGKLLWADIGKYSLAKEISWMSVGKQQLEYAAGVLRKFRSLVEQLAKVNPGSMTYNEKLAFWINIYNALMMHAYLAYGVPGSVMKLYSLMQKAAYTVGGYSFNAVDIEYVILKMKPPTHRPQMALLLALHKFKVSEEQSKYVLDRPEPLVHFGLSCGVYSSPAVRVFTPGKVHDDLQDALHDYVRASVGINNKGKLLVPKLLHSFTKGMIEENELVDWLCQFLSPSQAAVVQDSTLQRRQRLLSFRNFCVIPFDFRFRYLLLPENSY